jgi:filamentous hemagglutinin family protein
MKRHGSLNHIFRLVWSRVTHCWVAVAETTRARGKGGGKSARRKLVAARLSLTAITLTSPFALAGPTGGQVVSGAGTISQSGATTTIKQGSQNLSLDWTTFNIAPQETVEFVQPSASAIAVNRILGSNGSQILGHLDANGQVFLINPNGILFGAGAQVNVGGLVASTLDVTDADSSGSTRTLSGNGSGSVVNQGTINAANGSYVALVGNHVSNQGTITAQLGTVALGAGSGVTLTFRGDSLLHLQVVQSVLNSLADNGGLIRADGGTVVMTAGAANTLMASVVNNTGVIEARTVQNLGDGQSGTITLLGGMTAGMVDVGGTLDASAPNGGNGGSIETSAARVKVSSGAKVTTAATLGSTGSWSVDPYDFTIASSGGDITPSTLDSALASGSVTIATNNSGVDCTGATCGAGNASGTGNINVEAPVSWSAHTLTLSAYNNINFSASLTGTGTAALALKDGQASTGGGASSYSFYNGADINLPAGTTNFTTQLGSTGSTAHFTVITSLGNSTSGLQGINENAATLSANYALGSNITASGSFTPIGSFNATAFSGTFDGLGHTISALSISTNGSGNGTGLFGDSSGWIRNVGLTGGSVAISNGFYGGALVGVNYGKVSNSYSTNSVAGTNGTFYIGGLVGWNLGTITNSYTNAVVSGDGTSTFVGGLAGANTGGTISNSYTTGNVAGFANSAGGLVGENDGRSATGTTGTIANSYATGSVSGASYVGGLVGYNYGNGVTAGINASYAAGVVSGLGSGGLVGVNDASNGAATIANSYWNSSNTATGVGSLLGGASSSGASGLSTANLMQSSHTSAGLSTSTWVTYNGYTYPLLQSFMTPLTVTANAAATYTGTTYNDSGITLSYTSYGAAVTPTSALVTSSVTYTGTGQTAVHAGSSYTIIPGNLYSTQQGYLITGATGNLTIDPKTLTPTLTNSGVTKTYDGTINAPIGFTPTYSLSGLVSGDTSASLTDTSVAYNSAHVVSASGMTVSGLSISGITGSDGSLPSDYTLASASASVAATIMPALLTMGLSNVFGVTKTYDGTTAAPAGFIPTYRFSGLVAGDSATLSSSATPVFNSAHVIAATAITQSGLSLAWITGNGSDNSVVSDYTLSSTLAATRAGVASITPASLTPTVTNSGVTKTYDGTTNAPTGFTPTYSFSGLISGDTGANLTDTSVAYDNPHVVGASGVTVSGLSVSSIVGSNSSLASDYTLASGSASVAAAITPAPLTISLSNVADVTKTYDGTTAAPAGYSPTYSFSGLVAGDSATLSSAATPVFNSAHVVAATAITQTGLTLTSITGNGSDNSELSDYTLSSTVAATGAGVAGILPLTLTATAPTIGGTLTKTYDGTTVAAGASLSGGSVSGAMSGDTMTLDSSAVTLAYNSSHSLTASSIAASGSLSVDIIASTNGSQSTDYSVAPPAISPVAGTITPAPLTVGLSNVTNVAKTYDGTTAAPGGFSPTYSLSGLIAGDSATLSSSATPVFNSAHAPTATAITQGGLSLTTVTSNGSDNSVLSDYMLSNGTASTGAGVAGITPATLTLTLTNSGVTKTYDGTTNAPTGFTPTFSLSGLVSGDTGAFLSDTSVAYNSAHVVSASGVTVSGLSISGVVGSHSSLASDYTLASSGASVAATITPLTLTATAPTIGGTLSKVYNGTTAASGARLGGGSVSGALSGDSLSLDTDAITLAYNSSHVVSASSIGASGSVGLDINSSTNGSQSTDYSVQLPTIGPVAASITAASLTATLTNSGVTKTYDGTTNAPTGFIPTYSLSGLVSGDTGASLIDTSAAFNSAHVVSASGVTVSGMSVSGITGSDGSLASDYTLASSSASVAATITPLTLTATAPTIGGTLSKVYNGTTAASGARLSGGSVSGALSGDSLSLDDSAITLAYNTAQTTATTIVATGTTSLSITSSTADSLLSDYSLTQPTIAPVAGTITAAPAPMSVYSLVLPSQILMVFQTSTQPESFPSSEVNLPVNDDALARLGLSLHVVDGGVRLPDDMVVVNE